MPVRLQVRPSMRALICLLTYSVIGLSLAGCGSAAGSLPQQQAPRVTAAPAIEREVRDIDEYTGRTESVQTVEVRPRVTGYLQEIYFEEGGYVKVGDPLFLIDPRTYQAEYNQAQAKIKLYEAKIGR